MKIIPRIILICVLLSSCVSDNTPPSKSLDTQKTATALRSLLDQSAVFIDDRKLDSAKITLDSALTLALDIQDTSLWTRVLNNFGSLNYQLGNPDKSIKFYLESIELDRILNDSSWIGIKLKNLAISTRQKGNNQQALSYLLKALPLIQKLKNREEEASVNNSIGNLYNDLDQFEKGYDYLIKSQKAWHELGDSVRNSKALSNIGNSLLGMERVNEAIMFYDKSIALKRILNLKYPTAITLSNLGEAMFKLENYPVAREHFIESIRLREESGQKAGIALVANNMAALEIEIGHLTAAQKWLDRANSIIEETGALDKKTENLRLQKNLYSKIGEYRGAYETSLLYDEIKQMAFNEQVVKVNELQYEYDISQEEKGKLQFQNELIESQKREQIQLVKSRNQTIAIIAALIILTVIAYFAYNLRTKNRHIENLIRELHHRVKNHLGMISGMFGAQTLGVAGHNTDLLEEAKARVEAVNGIHRRLYRQDEYEFVNMQEYLTELVDNSALVFGVFHSLEKQLDIQSEPMEIDKAISVGLIANEVLTNAFKYGLQKTEKPTLKIVLEKAMKGYRMLIYNNAEPSSELTTESTGFGSELIKRLADNLKGETHTTEQNGFHFELTFP